MTLSNFTHQLSLLPLSKLTHPVSILTLSNFTQKVSILTLSNLTHPVSVLTLSKLLPLCAKEVLHVVGCEMVPVPARRWVEAGRAARLARSVGTDLGERREHPQFWKVESREDQVRPDLIFGTIFNSQNSDSDFNIKAL